MLTENLTARRDDSPMKLDDAEIAAGRQTRHTPRFLILWRNYHIGGSEIDAARERFLEEPGADPKTIEAEYQAAQAREIAGERAGAEWDKRTGITALRREEDLARRARRRAALRVARTKPTTPAGVAALITYILKDIGPDGEFQGWGPGLKTAAAACLELKS